MTTPTETVDKRKILEEAGFVDLDSLIAAVLSSSPEGPRRPFNADIPWGKWQYDEGAWYGFTEEPRGIWVYVALGGELRSDDVHEILDQVCPKGEIGDFDNEIKFQLRERAISFADLLTWLHHQRTERKRRQANKKKAQSEE